MRFLFAVLVALIVMCGAEVRTPFADPPLEDDGGGCTSQPCLGGSNDTVGQQEATGPRQWGKKFITGDWDSHGGLVGLADMRGPEKLSTAVRRILNRLRGW